MDVIGSAFGLSARLAGASGSGPCQPGLPRHPRTTRIELCAAGSLIYAIKSRRVYDFCRAFDHRRFAAADVRPGSRRSLRALGAPAAIGAPPPRVRGIKAARGRHDEWTLAEERNMARIIVTPDDQSDVVLFDERV